LWAVVVSTDASAYLDNSGFDIVGPFEVYEDAKQWEPPELLYAHSVIEIVDPNAEYDPYSGTYTL